MKPAEAIRTIRARAVSSANIVFIRHAMSQMQRRGIDGLQVLRCLQRGQITEGPYRQLGTGQWRCNVEAMAGGELIRVVVEIPDAPPLLEIITVIGVE